MAGKHSHRKSEHPPQPHDFPLSDEELAELLAKNPSTVFVSTDEGDEAVDPAPADVN